MNDARDQDPFRPLNQSERAATHDKRDNVNAGEIVAPIPSGMSPPLSHSNLALATAYWSYRNSEGEPLFYVMRFDPPDKRKVFLPLTLRRDAKACGGAGWDFRRRARFITATSSPHVLKPPWLSVRARKRPTPPREYFATTWP
jgi:hypothetical protein